MTLFLVITPDGPVIARANRKHHVPGLGLDGEVHTLLPDGMDGVVWDGREGDAESGAPVDSPDAEQGAGEGTRFLGDKPKRGSSRRKAERSLSDPPETDDATAD